MRDPSERATDATVLLKDVLVGREQLGPYHLEGVIGQGGMGVVFRARGRDGQLVAVKAIRADLINPDLRARFDREAAIRVDHPNVVRTLDAGTDALGGIPWIAFELLEGRSLEQRLHDEPPLRLKELVRILIEVCEGVGAAHAKGIVHRDLKPANVFLQQDGTVKVLDFGVALVRTESRLTGDASVLGTLGYLSPEQARGARDVDARADVWAIGALAYEALAKRLPFERPAALAMLFAILQDEPVPIERAAPGISDEIARLIKRCLAKRREDRFPDARSLAEALAAVSLGADLVVGATPSASRLPGRSSLRVGELRAVVILLARGVVDPVGVERIIVEHGGTALEVLGDDIIGIFGSRVWRGDEVASALRAGIALRHLADRVSVATGRAHAEGRTGIAGRALSAAEEACRAGLDGVAVAARTVSPLGLAFVSQPAIDDLVEVLAERTSDGELDEAEPTPLVGRAPELAALRHAVESARGKATVVVLAGPPGVGKTRLRREAERMVREAPGAIVLAARGEPLQRDTSFAIFGAALRRHARMSPLLRRWPPLTAQAPPLVQRQALLALVREAIPERDDAARCAEFLGELLGLSIPDSPALAEARRDPQLMADRLRLALLDYLAGLARRGTLAVLLEDVQWADAASVSLASTIETSLAAPMLMLVTLRASPGDVLPGGDDARQIVLSGLGAADVQALAERVAGARLSPRLATELARRTEGNPLFVEQIATALRERRESDRGELLLEQVETLPLPFTVEGAIQARLDDLPEQARTACKVASVFGRPVDVAELGALGIDEPAAQLATLVSREVMEAQIGGRATGAREFAFRSSLVAAVAYRMIAREVRVGLHLRAAEHLAARAAPAAEEIAIHFERGEESHRAAAWYARAGLAAATRGDAERALRCSERALELGVPQGDRFALHAARADTFRFLRRRPDQGIELAQALEVANTSGERARALVELAGLSGRLGDYARADGIGQSAIEEADASGELDARALARAERAQSLALAGRHPLAANWASEAAAIAENCGPRVRALVAESSATVAAVAGDLGQALERYAEAAQLFQDVGDVRRAAGNEGNLADCYNRVGAYDDAERALTHALAGCRRVGNRVFEGFVLANLGYARARAGRFAAALEALDGADGLAADASDARLATAAALYRARALLGAGRHADAASAIVLASAAAESAGERALGAAADCLAANLALLVGDVATALERSEKALGVRDEIGGCEDEGDIFLARADALAAAGRASDAAAVRARGAKRIVEVADGIRNPRWRDSFVAGVYEHRRLLE